MKKLDMRPFMVPGSEVDSEGKAQTPMLYRFRKVLINIGLFCPELQKKGKFTVQYILKVGPLADIIEKCDKDFLLLEDEEYKLIHGGFHAWTSWGRGDQEALRRFENAEDYKANIIDEMQNVE